MRRIILALTLSLTVAGCAGTMEKFKAIETAFELGTASISNPVTKTRLNQMENAVILVFAGLETWKDLCARGQINVDCKQQIGEAQIYTRQIEPYLVQLRKFVKTNDQVNATLVFNSIIDLVGTVKAKAAAGGVTIKTTVGS